VKCIVLAAESSESQLKPIARALMPLDDQVLQIERQVHVLSLLGFKSRDITVAINEEHLADEKITAFLDSLPCEILSVRSTNSSSETFGVCLRSQNEPTRLLVVFGDAILGMRHLERLLGNQKPNSLLVRSPLRLSEKGLRLHAPKEGRILSSFEDNKLPWPWTVFAGAMTIAASTQKDLIDVIDLAKQGESIAEILVRHAPDDSVGLVDADNALIGSEGPSWLNSELRGGSFASLERRNVVLKRAQGSAAEKLSNEITWLENLPDSVKPFFTSVLAKFENDDEVSYEMPYYPHPSLRNKIMVGSISPLETIKFTDKVLEFLFDKVYSSESSHDVSGWFASKHLDRVVDRTLAASKVSPTIARLVGASKLVVNGRIVDNPLSVAESIRKNSALVSKLEPKVLRQIHGDLHFQNILVSESTDEVPFVLVDPRGELGGSDVYYDIGKLFHSFRGNYDLLHTGQFRLSLERNLKEQDLGSPFEAELTFPSLVLEERYAEIRKGLTPLVLKHLGQLGDAPHDALMKSLVSEGMHFSSLMPFHLSGHEPEEKAVAMYLTGALLLDDFLKMS
jgi:hypothetical protein